MPRLVLRGAPRQRFPRWLLNGTRGRSAAAGRNRCKAASDGKANTIPAPKQGPLAICCCNKRLRHGQRPRGEERPRRRPASRGSIPSRFILRPRAALCLSGSSWGTRGRSGEVFGGAGSEGRQVARLQQEEGCVSPNFREVWGWMKLARGRLAKPAVYGGGRF